MAYGDNKDDDKKERLAEILKKATENDSDLGASIHVEELDFDEITCEETLSLLSTMGNLKVVKDDDGSDEEATEDD